MQINHSILPRAHVLSLTQAAIPYWAWAVLGVFLIATGVSLFALLSLKRRRNEKRRVGRKRSVQANVQAVLTVQIASEQGDRNSQQDYCAFPNTIDLDTLKNVGLLCVLCDGMGGLSGGKKASKCCAETMISEFYRIAPTENQFDALRQCAIRADRGVSALTGTTKRLLHSGTTLVAVLVRNDTAYWLSVGDSRIYAYQGGELTRLTRDHNYALILQEQVSNGDISMDEALAQPDADALVSYIGAGELPIVDTGCLPLTMDPNDGILLCSDGVTKAMRDSEIEAVAAACHPEEFASALIDIAMQKDVRHDNTTALYISGKVAK